MERVWRTWTPREGVIEFTSWRDVREVKPCDMDLVKYDIWGSKAHVIMLWKQGLINEGEARTILRGLNEVHALHRDGKFKLDPAREDVHTNIESFIIEKYGVERTGALHSGRSRNDQITLDMRLYMRENVLKFLQSTIDLTYSLIKMAQDNFETVMPGFTHFQHATVTTFAHVLASFAEAEVRDALRYKNWYNLFNKNPLGSVAGYGTALPIDRELTSRLLAFDAPERNSLDPITNRWEAECELAAILSVATNHLSTIAQTLILLSTKEFSMLQLDDGYKTGSSIMPQKKNPCVMEIIRAKAALAHGHLMSLLSIGKASFIGYNRDTQWTKYLIMDLIREVHPAIEMVRGVVSSLKVNHEQMYSLSKESFVTATTLLESLVLESNLPFRTAKFLLEKAVRYSEEQGEEVISFQSLRRAMEEEGIKNLELLTENFVKKHQEPNEAIMRIQSLGGPQKEMLSESLHSLMDEVTECESWLKEKSEKAKAALEEIKKVESQLNL